MSLRSLPPGQPRCQCQDQVVQKLSRPPLIELLDGARSVPCLRLLLVDNHALFREGLARLLARRKEVMVVGQAEDSASALLQARRLRPDVVLMEVDLPGEDGVATTRRLKAELPEVTVVMLSIREDADKIVEAVKAGAQGYISKSIRLPELLDHFRALARGEVALTGTVATRLFQQLRGQRGVISSTAVLTQRELEVLALVAARLSNKEIASRLLVSEHTVKNHLKHILAKLDAPNRRAAASYGVAHGWVSVGTTEISISTV
jgi:DNA-binding NarL/FixJ family response regulator